MIDGYDQEAGKLCGRTQAHAPEVDGVVYIERENRRAKPGEMMDVKIIQALDYDLIGDILDA
jgi:ribosomal protein S12 methylthiotransferase